MLLETLRGVLQECAEAGDVQTCVCLLEVLKLVPTTLEPLAPPGRRRQRRTCHRCCRKRIVGNCRTFYGGALD